MRYLLRSNDRQRYYDGNSETTTSSRFTLPLAEALSGTYCVRDWSIPNTFYNVTSANSTIYIFQGTAKTATLLAGNYTSSNITTEIARALNAIAGISGTFACSYSSTTYKLTITNTTTAFQLDFSAAQVGCADLLGFYRHRSATSATSQTSDNVVSLGNTNSIFLVINEATQLYRNPRSSGIVSGTVRVPVNSAFGTTLTMDSKVPQQHLRFESPANVLNFSLRDAGGAVVDLLGGEFEIEIERVEQ